MKNLPLMRPLYGLATLILLVCFSSTGCVTASQVRSIVSDSNKAMLQAIDDRAALAELPNQELNSIASGGQIVSRNDKSTWEPIVSKIEAFITEHQDDNRYVNTIAALRLRQAVVLMNHEQFNLASAAFNKIDAAKLYTDRDKAIYALRKSLLYWFDYFDETSFTTDIQKKTRNHANAIRDHLTGNEAPKSEQIRDYLAEIQMWMVIRTRQAATEQNDVDLANTAYVKGLNYYASTFKPGEIDKLMKGTIDPTTGVRRQLRFYAIAEGAKRSANAVPNQNLSDNGRKLESLFEQGVEFDPRASDSSDGGS